MSESPTHDTLETHASMIEAGERRVLRGQPGIGLCYRCARAHIYRTKRSNDSVILCGELSGNIPMPLDIVECNRFRQEGTLSIWELTQLCLDIDLSKPNRKAGFVG